MKVYLRHLNRGNGGATLKNKGVVFGAASALLLFSFTFATYAHHGIVAWFDMSRSITVKGTVTSFEWTNPHCYIHLDITNDNGMVENWSGEMGGVPMLGRAGWRRETVKPGDVITLIGRPAKDRKPSMLLDKVVLASGQELQAADIPLPAAEGTKATKE